MRPPSLANGFFHRLGKTFQDADGKRKICCRFCGHEYAYNLTKLKEHLCNSGSHSCPDIDEELKFHADAIYRLERTVRKHKEMSKTLFAAVRKANKVLAMILKNDNRFGIPHVGLDDVEWRADEDPGGMMPVSVGNRVLTCPLVSRDTAPMAEGTRGEQIAATDGRIVGAEIGESPKGRANTLPEVDVSSPLKPSQENAEKDSIILSLVKLEAKFAALEQENGDFKTKLAALEQENADFKAKFAALEQENANLSARLDQLEWPNWNINTPIFENSEYKLPNSEDFNMEDWGNVNFAEP